MKLFDLQPKTTREDLFDREKELNELHKAIDKDYPLTALLGIRRIGKTSILKTFINEVNGIYIDMRQITKRADLQMRMTDSLTNSLSRIKKFIEGIRGLKIADLSIEIRWKGSDSISLAGLLEEINKKNEKFVLIFDEVQSLKPPVSSELKKLIAYAYDNLENIKFIVAGSEIGMLQNFLGYEDPSSPLYGRAVYEINVERFSKEKSREFLRKGFQEERVEPRPELIEKAIEFFDGIVGWLVIFGREYIDGINNMEKIKDNAIGLALSELEKLNPKEKMVLKAIASGSKTWISVRNYINEKYGIVIPKSTLSRLIDKLEKLSILYEYEFQDNVYMEAVKRMRVNI